MKVASAILIICAGVTAASTNHCVQDTYPQYNVRGTAYQLKELWLLPFKNSWSLRIPSFEICINTKPTAVSVTVCDEDARSKPSIFIFNPRIATISRNLYSIKNAVVYVTVFCESNNTVQIPQNGKPNEPLKIGRQFKQKRRPFIRKGHTLNKRYLFDTSFIPAKVPVPFRGGIYRQPQISSLDGTQHQPGESSVDGTDHIPNKSHLDGTLYKPLTSLPTKSYLNGPPRKPYVGSLVGSLPFYMDGSDGLVSSQADLSNKGYLDETLPKQFNSLVAAPYNNYLDGTPHQPLKGSTATLINNSYLGNNLGEIAQILPSQTFYKPFKGFPDNIPFNGNLNEVPYKQFNYVNGAPNKSYPDGTLNNPYERFFNSLPTQNYFNRPPYNPYASPNGIFGNIPFYQVGLPSDLESYSLVGHPSIIYMDKKHNKTSAGPQVATYRNSDKEIRDDAFYRPVNGFENISAKLSLATTTESISEDYINGYYKSPPEN